MNIKSYIASEEEILDLCRQYQDFQKESKNPYIRYFFKTDSKTISIYTSNKVVIQSKEEIKSSFDFQDHAGSDESGVGDYFGPLTVCATVVTEKDLAFLSQFNIKDSKQLKDDQIKKIAPELMKKLIYSLLILDNKTYNIENQKYNLNEFNYDDDKLARLTQIIKQGLVGEQGFCFLEVDAYVKLGAGQHVFPSQEMNMGEKRKSLFKIKDQAAMHNVKIGNALRTVDTWYEQDAKFPIAAEPYGAVTQRGQAYRPSSNDLYTLMINWVNNKEVSPEEQAYVVSNLIRGGVFSKIGKDSKE